ncbi:MAG: inositol monophosphatase family protein [bacterium]|nr:inositol monophosphatase family protein [bacterium]
MAIDPHLIADALAVAHRAADAAARIHRGHAGAALEIGTKSTATDLVTEVDRLSEAAIRAEVAAVFPDHVVLGEEDGQPAGDARYRWIVDPLDGTVNYAHGFPFYCTSIALEVDGRVVVGVVLDTARGERFSATAGGGAFRDGVPIRVSETRTIGEAMLATGFPYGGDAIARNLALFARVLPEARAIRRPGAAALDLCQVACGRFDGYWELKMNAWDVAAGLLIVREAGGTVTGPAGAPYLWDDAAIVATNGRLHAHLLDLLDLGVALA